MQEQPLYGKQSGKTPEDWWTQLIERTLSYAHVADSGGAEDCVLHALPGTDDLNACSVALSRPTDHPAYTGARHPQTI